MLQRHNLFIYAIIIWNLIINVEQFVINIIIASDGWIFNIKK